MRLAAFRFSVLYLGLYAFATQIAGGVLLFPGIQFPALGTIWPMRDVTLWLAEQVFGAAPPLVYSGNSGDTVFHWVQTAWLLAAAAIVTAVWTVGDRRRAGHPALAAWFRLLVRLGLAAQMFYYGMAKVVPSQFPPPSLVTLVEPLGHLSPSDLLWAFMGSSTAYQVFTGCAELAAGVLLLTPRTATLGALIALIDMIQVFALNMTYDFGLKQISFHLMLLSLVLLAPEWRRLAGVIVLDRPVGPSRQPALFRSAQANRLATGAQIVFGVYLLAMFTSLALRYYSGPGGAGAPKSALYGIWSVEELAIDGEVRPPVLNDYDRRWRRVIFDSPAVLVFQRTDDSFARYGVTVDEADRSLALTKGGSRTWGARFTYERPSDDRLLLEGRMDDYEIRMRLTRLELDTFRLLSSPFRWVRPPDPFAG